jgi:trk system potassium uptake protein
MRHRFLLAGWSPPSVRPILFLTGIMLVALSAAMLLPAAVDALAGSPNWQSFLIAGLITFAFGAGLSRGARCRLVGGLSLRQAFLLTPFAWTTLVLSG